MCSSIPTEENHRSAFYNKKFEFCCCDREKIVDIQHTLGDYKLVGLEAFLVTANSLRTTAEALLQFCEVPNLNLDAKKEAIICLAAFLSEALSNPIT